jgi:beta-galactosidase
MDQLLYGVSYYDEYMPYDRIDTDVQMLKTAHLNVVRIAESTWSTLEPQPGVFDLTHLDRMLEAFGAAGIHIIIGTPTYAVPTWLVQSHPDVLAVTKAGEGRYGARQIMNIVSPAYRFYGERVIRRLLEHTAHHPGVVGFQLDNETKYYNVASTDVQRAFVKYLRQQFSDDLEAMNHAFGLDYWSNRVNAWEDFPDVRGTINGSLGSAFDKFRRSLVAEYLAWQAALVGEYKRDDQFITHNFDFDWGPGWSYGLQPAVDHFAAAACLDIAGVDIYHPTESALTGKEIAFGGDMTRSLKAGDNYLVLETQAQGQLGWLPYPGQLRLQAYSHFAGGADGVAYWHWHSIHNSFETHWRGLLSHDLEPNPTYEEAGVVGAELDRIGAALLHLAKTNEVAVLVSNDALTALTWFTIETGFIDFPPGSSIGYNDVLRWLYDALFELNVECDFITPGTEDLSRYAIVVVPALYSAPEDALLRLRQYVHNGGNLISSFKSAVADEHVKVWSDRLPHALTDVFGLTYNQFTRPDDVGLELRGDLAAAGDLSHDQRAARHFMELLRLDGAEALASYDHYAWADYAAITRHHFGAGTATYIGTMTGPDLLRQVLTVTLRDAGLWGWSQDLAGSVSVRRGRNAAGREISYFLNYSPDEVRLASPVAGRSLLDDATVERDSEIRLGRWDLAIVESE